MAASEREIPVSRMIELLCQAAKPVRVILFGSHACDSAQPDSDIDLLVVEPEVVDPADEIVRLNRVLSPLRLPIDLLVVSEETFRKWSGVPGTVYAAAAREGRVLYDRAA